MRGESDRQTDGEGEAEEEKKYEEEVGERQSHALFAALQSRSNVPRLG